MDDAVRSSPSPERRISKLLKNGLSKISDDLTSPTDSTNNLRVDSPDPSRVSTESSPEGHGGRSASLDLSRKNSRSRRLSSLVPGRSRRRKKRELSGLDGTNLDGGSGANSVREGGSGGVLGQSDSGSLSSPAKPRSIASSLMTEDSDPDPPRPPLVTRESHAPFLTQSSPLIKSKTLDPTKEVAESNTNDTTLVAEGISPTSNGPDRPSTPPQSDRISSFPLTDSPAQVSPPKPLLSPSSPVGNGLAIRTVDIDPSKPGSGVLGGLFGGKKPGPARPQTPTRSSADNESSETPTIVETPPTPNVPQSPFRDVSPVRKGHASKPSFGTLSLRGSSFGADKSAQARGRSGTVASSKLVNSTIPPSTPREEESKMFGGSFASFFSTVSPMNLFQAGPQKSKSVSMASEDSTVEGDEVIVPNAGIENDDASPREQAVTTLGEGNLMLSDFGQGATNSEPGASPPLTTVLDGLNRAEEASAAEAVSNAYAPERLGINGRAMSMVADQISNPDRPRSISSAVGSNRGDSTPPASVTNGAEGDFKRSGSMRSRISGGRRRRRKRGTSVGTGSTIVAALGATHSLIAPPLATPLSSYPVADSKRNRDFHLLFRSVSEDDHLITDYLAALQREILLQGNIYISEKSICFYSNIIGWVTNLVISFDEVVALEKKNTVRLFPNAIVVQTLHSKHTFSSFLKRDSAYDVMLAVWRTHHSNLKITETGHALDNDPKAPTLDPVESDDEEEEDSEEYSGDDEYAGLSNRAPSIAPSDDPPGPAIGASQRMVSAGGPGQRMFSTTGGSRVASVADGLIQSAGADSPPQAGPDFPGPISHAPTECTDQATHYDKPLMDTVIAAPLGKVYSLMFGPTSGAAMRKFFVEDEKFTDIQMEDDKRGMDQDVKQFSYSYIKPLNAPIGPKTTKCIVNQILDSFDLERSISVTCSTLTPDVPSGSSFITKTRYCLMWAPDNSTRFMMNYTIEWSAKSWLKGAIEKGASDGQTQYGKDMVAFLKAQVSGGQASAKIKGKKRKKRAATATSAEATSPHGEVENAVQSMSWGPLEPLHGIVSPLADIIGPLISVNLILGVCLGLVSLLFLRRSYSGPAIVPGMSSYSSPERMTAYDELWKGEEAELWRWLEDRISLDGLGAAPKRRRAQKRVFASKLDKELMTDREVDDAIRVTQERLEALKEAVEQKRRVEKKGSA